MGVWNRTPSEMHCKHYWLLTKPVCIATIRNGVGLGLSTLGILLLLLIQHVNLRTIKEPPKTKYPWIKKSMKFAISFMIVTLFYTTTTVSSILFNWTIYVLHIRNILMAFFDFILIPKYYINQNENLKFYVSVYHHVPAPLLPWQLPKYFDPNSVKLVFVDYPKNE